MLYSKILIVDDSPTSRMIIQRCFMMSGFEEAEFLFAANGLDAITMMLNNQGIDFIVTDLNMPWMDGEMLIEKVRKFYKFDAVPILVISSIENDVLKKKLDGYNIAGIIHKPLTPQKLCDAMGAKV